MNGKKPPFENRQMTILMLPDDLLLNCLARVSRLDYPTLSLVSKRFRSLVTSTELYQTRALLGRTESCLYVCLRHCTDSYPLCWFTLCRRPHSSKKTLFLIPSPPSLSHSGVAVVGPNIYTTGGYSDLNASSSVTVMDCRSHKWREAPSMQLARVLPSACVLDEKIYVAGGCENLDSTNWMEVFDTRTQTWEFLQIPSEKICGGSNYRSVRYEGTVHVRSQEKNATYKLHRGRWRAADLAINYRWKNSSAHCVIENVFYSYCSGKIDWYDSKTRMWIALKGLEMLPSLCRGRAILTDYGGNMAVLWKEFVSMKESKIWCAEIAIEKRQKGEIWGIINWVDVVSTGNEPYSLAHALVTTL